VLLLVTPGPPTPHAALRSGATATGKQDGAHKQPRREKAGHKGRRRCRARPRRRLATRPIARRRACWRTKRPPRRKKRRAPVLSLPAVPPPSSAPAPAPTPPVAAPPGLAPASCAAADTIPTTSNLPAIRAATLCLVNAERTSRGLAPLIDNAPLALAAQGHATDMATQRYFSHVSADGRTFDVRMRNAGYAGGYLAENIAWGGSYLGTPRRIVGGWMNSAGHRANILNGALRDSGVGVAPRTPQGGSGGTYVHDLGAP